MAIRLTHRGSSLRTALVSTMARPVFRAQPVAPGLAIGRLGLSGSVLGSEPVSAGPMWTGGGYVLTDGVLYFTGPTVGGVGRTLWARVSRPSAPFGSQTVVATYNATPTLWMINYQQTAIEATLYGGATRVASKTATTTGSHTLASRTFVSGANLYPADIVVDGGTPALISAGAGIVSRYVTMQLTVAGYNAAPAPAGVSVWEVAYYGSALSDADLIALHNGGTQSDPRTLIATQPEYLWDFANIDASGNVYDLVAGAYNLTITGGDATDFGTGTF